MASIFFPDLNPVTFFNVARANLPKYFTKHFEDYPFEERQYFWQQSEDFEQVWQTTDIIYLQFEASIEPIAVSLLDDNGNAVIVLSAVIGLPNKFLPGTYSYEVNMALSGLSTGCYRVQVEAGTGADQQVFLSGCQYISAVQLPNTLCIEYWHSKFHKDVIFETGIKFQFRVLGVFGYLDKVRKDEQYRDEKYNPTLLNSKSSKQWPVYFGIPGDGLLSKKGAIGLPDDMINLIDEAFGCDNVLIDGKPFGIADGAKPEYTVIESTGLYPKRGMKLIVEAGINRNSRLYTINADTHKKIITTVIVDAKVFGDLANSGSSNAVPVYNVQE